MTREEAFRAALIDLALIASGVVTTMRARPARQRLVAAVARARDSLRAIGATKPSPQDAEHELAAALAHCRTAGVPWNRVVDKLNDWSEATPSAHRALEPTS